MPDPYEQEPRLAVLPESGFLDGYPLDPTEEIFVDLEHPPLYSPEETEEVFGIYAPGLISINAGGHEFMLLDGRDHHAFNTPFLLVDSSYDFGAGKGYLGVRPDKPVLLGQRHYRDRFELENTVSFDHFALYYHNGELGVHNLNPTGTTTVSGNFHTDNPSQMDYIVDNFTHAVVVDMQERFDYGPKDETAPYGYYQRDGERYFIIGRKTTSVKGGVYFTTRPMSEAVLVDHESEEVENAYRDLKNELIERYGSAEFTAYMPDLLTRVMRHTEKVLRYDMKAVEKLSSPHYDDNGLINLSTYMKKGVGVCRHQCLLAALLLEKLVDDKIIIGTVGVERNHDIEVHGAHAWAIFKQPANPVYVIDSAQHFAGTKHEARRRGKWKYDLHAQ